MKGEADIKNGYYSSTIEASGIFSNKINDLIPLIPSYYVLFNKEIADWLIDIILNDIFIPLLYY